jgi:hypothetical protein
VSITAEARGDTSKATIVQNGIKINSEIIDTFTIGNEADADEIAILSSFWLSTDPMLARAFLLVYDLFASERLSSESAASPLDSEDLVTTAIKSLVGSMVGGGAQDHHIRRLESVVRRFRDKPELFFDPVQGDALFKEELLQEKYKNFKQKPCRLRPVSLENLDSVPVEWPRDWKNIVEKRKHSF